MSGAAHPHLPLMQLEPAAQACPHAPQFFASVLTSTSQPSSMVPLQFRCVGQRAGLVQALELARAVHAARRERQRVVDEALVPARSAVLRIARRRSRT